jgi:hypothetical protein
MKMDKKIRQTAYKISIQDIFKGTYVKEAEEFAPNYIDLGGLKLSRVNLIGVIISIQEDTTENSFIIDDGSGRISVRNFEQILEDIKVGNIVNIIGRPREYASERYVAAEIIRKVDTRWMLVRKKELGGIGFREENKIENGFIEHSEPVILSNHDKIIGYIRKNDKGGGVNIEEVIRDNKIDNCEKIVEDMLKEGDLFENAPGKLKILE